MSEMTEKKIRGWLRLSSLVKINIFMDHNKIIRLLCVELLKAKGLNPSSSEELSEDD